MALINHRAREVHFKIVYCGPALGGKTTNLRHLYERLPADRRGRLISIATDHERTLFFDFLPVELGQVQGLLTRFHLYTVPGQLHYRLSRRSVLQGADGLVFVVDSMPWRFPANLESLEDLRRNLVDIGVVLARVPLVVQYNKRDLPQASPVERLRAALNPRGLPEFESVATSGRGVVETLRSICKTVLLRLDPPRAASPNVVAPPVAMGATLAPPAFRPAVPA
jgi:signal recognition particle receptor subunit beta